MSALLLLITELRLLRFFPRPKKPHMLEEEDEECDSLSMPWDMSVDWRGVSGGEGRLASWGLQAVRVLMDETSGDRIHGLPVLVRLVLTTGSM